MRVMGFEPITNRLKAYCSTIELYSPPARCVSEQVVYRNYIKFKEVHLNKPLVTVVDIEPLTPQLVRGATNVNQRNKYAYW